MSNTSEFHNIFNKIEVLDIIEKDDFEKVV